MEWRVTIELCGADGRKQTHEVARGGCADLHSTLEPLGLMPDDGKALLPGVQRHLVQARVAEYSALRRRCSHCRRLRPLKDTRTRRLTSLFGTVEVPAPRFKPRRCAIAVRSTLSPASELMPDRCTPEYERTLAKMGAWLPYRRARRFLSEFFSIGDDPSWQETIRRRTAKVGAGLECETLARAKTPRTVTPSETMTVSIDAGHVRAVRRHQGRTFEVMTAQVSNDDGKPVLFSGVPGDADRQRTLAAVKAKTEGKTAAARSAATLAKALNTLESHVSCLAHLIIDYASARLDDEPFSTSPTEGTAQWLRHRRMGARQQMRWSPRGANLMLQVRTAIVNGTLD